VIKNTEIWEILTEIKTELVENKTNLGWVRDTLEGHMEKDSQFRLLFEEKIDKQLLALNQAANHRITKLEKRVVVVEHWYQRTLGTAAASSIVATLIAIALLKLFGI